MSSLDYFIRQSERDYCADGRGTQWAAAYSCTAGGLASFYVTHSLSSFECCCADLNKSNGWRLWCCCCCCCISCDRLPEPEPWVPLCIVSEWKISTRRRWKSVQSMSSVTTHHVLCYSFFLFFPPALYAACALTLFCSCSSLPSRTPLSTCFPWPEDSKLLEAWLTQ